MKRVTKPQDEAAARHYVDLLRQHDFGAIGRDLEPGLRGTDMDDTLAELAAAFPNSSAKSVKVVGSHTLLRSDSPTADITLEYEFPDQWILAEVALQTRDGKSMITSLHVVPISDSLEHQNRFTLADKNLAQYTTLCMAIAATALSVYAFILCLRSRINKKWLWSVISFVGVGRLAVNWTTGVSSFTLFSVYLPPGQANASLYSPWFVFVSLPLGAVLFLTLRENLIRSATVSSPAIPASEIQSQVPDLQKPTR